MALEYLNICEFSRAQEVARTMKTGLSSSAGRGKKIYKLNLTMTSGRTSPRLGQPCWRLEVLNNNKQLWNDARSSAEMEKFRQAEHEPSTPSKKRARSLSPPTPPKEPSARQKKNCAPREKQRAGKPARTNTCVRPCAHASCCSLACFCHVVLLTCVQLPQFDEG